MGVQSATKLCVNRPKNSCSAAAISALELLRQDIDYQK
jgi:hypothetical protein